MAKDPREYGYEGEMAMSQLKGILTHAKQLHDMLKPETDLPEWVQSKITLAYDYIQTAADYMNTEMNEEVERKYGKGQSVIYTGKGPLNGKKMTITGLTRNKRYQIHDGRHGYTAHENDLKEEAPTNAVGDGAAVAGLRPDTIGVRRKAQTKYAAKNAAEAPILGDMQKRKTFTQFSQGK